MNNMLEKVYTINDYWDMTILNGIAEYHYKKYYFDCVFSNDIDYWTNNYNLTLLNDSIFKLAMENWDYWIKYLDKFHSKEIVMIPHPVEYAKSREKLSVEEIFATKNVEHSIIELAENYYQNDIIINEYLKKNKPKYKLEGIFSGDFYALDTKVEWKNAIEYE